MKKIERVHNALIRGPVDKFPVFISATPQFMKKALPSGKLGPNPSQIWNYCSELNLDIIQAGHPVFYPVKILELKQGDTYLDKMGRNHIIKGYYDNFTAPFALQSGEKLVDIEEIESSWNEYKFPDPEDPSWFEALKQIKRENEKSQDPLSIWGVINGPLEPTWQLMSDGWPAFFILYRRAPELAREIINKVADFCIKAGQAMIEHGVHAIRIGDDYALNEGLMTSTKVWKELVYPAHQTLIKGLKEKGGKDFPVILHSDGNIMDILELLATGDINGESNEEIHIDGLNPIQPDALEFEEVVNKIGDRLSMTGAFDLRYFLDPPNKDTRQQMETEIRRLFSIMRNFNGQQGNQIRSEKGPERSDRSLLNTGFCIGPTHQIQPRSYVDTFEMWIELIHQMNKH